MIIDSSALAAVLLQEPGAGRFAKAIESAAAKFMSAPTYLELCMVIAGRRQSESVARVDAFIREADISLLPFTAAAARVAVEAFLKYGKGRHPAGLNFGDCISYALAKTELMPLLFKGNDFRLTDVEAVL